MMIKILKSRDFIWAICLVFLGVLSRTVMHIGPNVEFITAISLVSGYFLKNKKISFMIVLFIMYITDIIIGNSVIFLFTWSGFAIAPLLGVLLSKLKIQGKFKEILVSTIAVPTGLVSTMIFFFWTNFGVVLTTNMYSKDLEGILLSYKNAVPFLVNQLSSNLIIVPSLFLIVFVLEKLAKLFANKVKTDITFF